MPGSLTNEQVAEIAECLAHGRKIQAIKLYREATGAGLKEAKDFIDALVPKLLEEDPEKYAAVGGAGSGDAADRGKKGCLLLVVGFFLASGVAFVVAHMLAG